MRTWLAFAIVIMASLGFGQDKGLDIQHYLDMVKAGQVDEVNKELPALANKYPDNPVVTYLQATVNPDGGEAARMFQGIVVNSPHSEWAPEALYKVYQFYQSIGLYKTADLKLAQLRRDYPQSKYAGGTVEPKETREPKGTKPPVVQVTTRPPVVKADTADAPIQTTSLTPSSAKKSFTLQFGAFSTEANANRATSQLVSFKLPAEVVQRKKDGKTLFIVWSGSFETKEEAMARSADVKTKCGLATLVVGR